MLVNVRVGAGQRLHLVHVQDLLHRNTAQLHRRPILRRSRTNLAVALAHHQIRPVRVSGNHRLIPTITGDHDDPIGVEEISPRGRNSAEAPLLQPCRLSHPLRAKLRNLLK